MKILLNELEKANHQTLLLEGSIQLDSIQHYDVISLERFRFDGKVHKEAELVVVDGIISGQLNAKCSKCLKQMDYTLTVPFHECFAEGAVEEDSEIHSFTKGMIDLAPFFHEAVMLEIPHVFICSDTCKGLCPTCGVNRNEASCECSNERIDPRLADLALFFQKENN